MGRLDNLPCRKQVTAASLCKHFCLISKFHLGTATLMS